MISSFTNQYGGTMLSAELREKKQAYSLLPRTVVSMKNWKIKVDYRAHANMLQGTNVV